MLKVVKHHSRKIQQLECKILGGWDNGISRWDFCMFVCKLHHLQAVIINYFPMHFHKHFHKVFGEHLHWYKIVCNSNHWTLSYPTLFFNPTIPYTLFYTYTFISIPYAYYINGSSPNFQTIFINLLNFTLLYLTLLPYLTLTYDHFSASVAWRRMQNLCSFPMLP